MYSILLYVEPSLRRFSAVGLGVDKFSLYVKNLKTRKLIEKFEPRNIPYDSIFIQRPNGFVSFAALNWLEKHAVSLTVMDWKGNVLAQFLPEEPVSNELKIAQFQAYLNRERHLSIAKRIVETKLERQSQLLRSRILSLHGSPANPGHNLRRRSPAQEPGGPVLGRILFAVWTSLRTIRIQVPGEKERQAQSDSTTRQSLTSSQVSEE